MSAHLFPLDPQLQEAWEAGALTYKEAWLVQDELIVSPEQMVEMPPHLEPQMRSLLFFQVPPENSLPL